jgi:hypothetical protein
MKYIDATPTWGQWGNIFYRFAMSREVKALAPLRHDFALVCSIAEAFKEIQGSLTEEQIEKANAVMVAEMAKQGCSLTGRI